MLKSGAFIVEIVQARSLSTNTIETHMLSFTESGEVKIKQLVQAHRIELIKKQF